MLIADENIDFRIIEALRQKGIEVYSVFEELRGISDFEIIELSNKTGFTILTEDKDFGEWVFAHKTKGISVILLRYTFTETNDIIGVLFQVLKMKNLELKGLFTTITAKKIRQRRI